MAYKGPFPNVVLCLPSWLVHLCRCEHNNWTWAYTKTTGLESEPMNERLLHIQYFGPLQFVHCTTKQEQYRDIL